MTLAAPQRQWIFATGALALAALVGIGIGQYGVLAGVGFVALMLGVIAWLWPESVFILTIITIVIGQLVRLPILGSDNSVILNDLLLPVLIVVWVLKKLGTRSWKIPKTGIFAPLAAWVAVMILSLLFNWDHYAGKELLSGSLFMIRWIEYAAALIIGFDMVRTRQRAIRYLAFLVWTGVVVALLGFVQLKLFPDFSFMVPEGWDPHIGRLLSTWFDPNFLAGYLALLTTICLAIALSKDFVKAKWWWAAIAVMSVAIIFTFSRSGYVALAAGAGLVTIVRSRTIFFLGIAIFLATVLFIPRVQERVIGIRTVDQTAQLRLVSWGNAWEVISDHPVWGVGYNLYKYVQVQYGFLDNTKEHSASGSDSSFLTVWVTTGLVGFVVWWWLAFAIVKEAWLTWRDRHLPEEWRGYGLGLVAALGGLFVHSQFVNSLLYPHMMQAMWLLVAIAIMVRQPEHA